MSSPLFIDHNSSPSSSSHSPLSSLSDEDCDETYKNIQRDFKSAQTVDDLLKELNQVYEHCETSNDFNHLLTQINKDKKSRKEKKHNKGIKYFNKFVSFCKGN